MRIDSLFAQMIYRGIFLVLSAGAVALTFAGSDGFNAGTFLYYTSWSNWLIFAVTIAVFAGTVKRYARGETHGHNEALRFLKANATVLIFVTFAVYAFVLPDAPLIAKADYWTDISNLLKHFICPLMFVFDWILFDAHGIVKVSWPFKGLILPLIYCIAVEARAGIYAGMSGGTIPEAELGNYFPYFFLDFQTLGVGGLFMWIGILICVFTALGFVVFGVDKIGCAPKRRAITAEAEETAA